MKGRHRLKANETIGSSRLAMASPIAAQLGRVREPRLDRQPTPVEVDDGTPPWVAAEVAALRAAERRLRKASATPTERIKHELADETDPGREEEVIP